MMYKKLIGLTFVFVISVQAMKEESKLSIKESKIHEFLPTYVKSFQSLPLDVQGRIKTLILLHQRRALHADLPKDLLKDQISRLLEQELVEADANLFAEKDFRVFLQLLSYFLYEYSKGRSLLYLNVEGPIHVRKILEKHPYYVAVLFRIKSMYKDKKRYELLQDYLREVVGLDLFRDVRENLETVIESSQLDLEAIFDDLKE